MAEFGAQKSKGEFLAFIDADYVVDKGWLRNALRRFQSPPSLALGLYGFLHHAYIPLLVNSALLFLPPCLYF